MSGVIINPFWFPSGGGGGGSPTRANVWKNVGNSGSSLAVTVSPTAGSLLVAAVAEYQSTADNTAISDNIGSTTGWTKIVRKINGDLSVVLWYKANIGSGVTTVTLTTSTGASYYNCHVHEISGANTSTPFTTGESASNSGAASSGSTGAATNATATSVWVAIVTNDSGSNPETFTLNASGTTGGTFSHYNSAASETNGAVNLVSSSPSASVTAGASTNHFWTFPGSRTYAAAIAAFH